MKNIFILFCLFSISFAFPKNARASLKQTHDFLPPQLIKIKSQKQNLSATTGIQQDVQMEFANKNCNKPSNLKIINNDIELPESVGQFVENCHQNPNYNACIYYYSPFIKDGLLIPEFIDIFETGILLSQSAVNGDVTDTRQWMEDYGNTMHKLNETMRFYQNYAVNITETIGGLLKNEHYDVTIDVVKGSTRRLNWQLNGKWTTPYFSFAEYLKDSPIEPTRYLSVEQVMAYYYLMYQKEWMELNTGQWYASGKNISVDFSSVSLDGYGWLEDKNKIALPMRERLYYNVDIPGALHAFSIVHEAAHANFYHSNLSREGSKDETHLRCGHSRNGMCCTILDGCLRAINEGQADFNGFMLFPDAPKEVLTFPIEGFMNRESLRAKNESILSPFFNDLGNCHILRGLGVNGNLTSETAFNCGQWRSASGIGETHDMGALYASIWWEIYNREDTSKKDIATLFTEHLSLASNDDTFRTIAGKIINRTQELFDREKANHYTCVISQEFKERGFHPLF